MALHYRGAYGSSARGAGPMTTGRVAGAVQPVTASIIVLNSAATCASELRLAT